ncbi:BZ3500_MvSof-1268-A1-R1_Chr10-1g02618 [Microbotryum saponariae]|uniref:BZ3500_MvSof-1268-A1-R1_Chr10-1g02618 protein n=1 Tax=Microbotryum saponariae TaxID=289078 RepID=A0A2X0N902_9BASI|nr:BZ3500_MvSof-1268-A1-R1_Chr10-1g02618 [Microbotryum saponariae]SDA06107.1 BZ3501_MvSof-1269-A2-R1_Chr10-1g02219 [Microbotryum saponariae]
MPSMSDLSHYTLPSHTLPPGVPSIGGGSQEAIYRHRALPPPTSFDFYSPMASSCSAEFQARPHSLSNTNPLALLNFGSSSTLARSGYSIGTSHSGPTATSHPSYQPGSALMDGPSNSSFEHNGHPSGPFFLPPNDSSRPFGSSLFNANSSLHLPTPGFSQSSTRSTSGLLSSPTSATIPRSTPTGPQTPGQPYYYPPGWSMGPQSQTPPSNQISLPARVAAPGAVSSTGNCSAATASDVEWSNMLAATTRAAQSSPEHSEAQVPDKPHSERPQTPLSSPTQVHAAGAGQTEATHRSSHPSPTASPP